MLHNALHNPLEQISKMCNMRKILEIKYTGEGVSIVSRE